MVKNPTKLSPESVLLPIISITLFFAAWFDSYSYTNKFQKVFYFFNGSVFTGDAHLSEKISSLLILIGLGLIIFPFKDKLNLKWGALALTAFLIFIFENFDDFPYVANHDMMMVFLSVGFLITFASYLIQGDYRQAFTNIDYLPLMRASLLIMYFFGTFHKINSGFLSGVGCWAGFYNTIPLMPEALLDPKLGVILGGYGTLVVEAAAMIMLCFPRTKYYGMIIGMIFHYLIAISGSGTVAHFSALAFALHMSFLSKDSIQNFMNSRVWRCINFFKCGFGVLRGYLVLCLLFTIFLSWSFIDIYNEKIVYGLPSVGYFYVRMMWWFYAPLIMLFVLLYGRTVEDRPQPFVISRIGIANIATILLLLNSITTYVGLKSNADLAMFSNIRTEWGQSNHYVIQKPLYLFPYLKKENYIQVQETTHPDLIQHRAGSDIKDNKDLWLHKLEVQKQFDLTRRDGGEVFWIDYINADGKVENYDGYDENHLFHQKPNWWVRNYLVFTEFVNKEPRPCSAR